MGVTGSVGWQQLPLRSIIVTVKVLHTGPTHNKDRVVNNRQSEDNGSVALLMMHLVTK